MCCAAKDFLSFNQKGLAARFSLHLENAAVVVISMTANMDEVILFRLS